ncbi:hypothetical protein SEA_EDEN_48 [Microbacterium phage Eden]|uniref:Uncharacterized protein n=1 Tax=Microbacterium phage Eden TaxID=2250289 RepID=A0A345KWE1_9CAUD|nr:hypothetical protein HOT71_gp48 [Microbacterium phage Eden]AXH47343.1 hypothetical protein SEA_EDEN_48 [Microbacterium phage Eden]
MDFIKNRNSSQVQRAELETENFKIMIDVTLWGYSREDRRKARVSVSGYEDVNYDEAYALARENDGFIKGNNEEVDALFRKLNRLEVKNMKAVIAEAVAEVPELAAILEGVNLTFSKKAGCSCGCSPAFVPSRDLGVDGTYQEFNGAVKEAKGMRVRNLWITKKSA